MSNKTFIKKISTSALILVGALHFANAQEQLPREEALKYAFAVAADLAQLQGTPISTDVDLKNPIAVRDGDYGGMLLPEAKLTADDIERAGQRIVPIGQLWLHKVAPAPNGQVIGREKLRLAKVNDDGSELRVPQCTLGVRRTTNGSLEMVLLGKSTEPLATAPIRLVQKSSSIPFAISVDRDSDGGRAEFTLFGKYSAQLYFGELED